MIFYFSTNIITTSPIAAFLPFILDNYAARDSGFKIPVDSLLRESKSAFVERRAQQAVLEGRVAILEAKVQLKKD